MIEILFLLLFMAIMFIIAEFGATVLVSVIDFSSDSKEEKEPITHDVFFVCVKRNMNASYEARYDSFGFINQKDAEAYRKNLIQDGIPEENIKVEIRRR